MRLNPLGLPVFLQLIFLTISALPTLAAGPRGEADPNPTVSNDRVDLTGTNMGDEIFLTWDYDDNAAEYVVFRAPSLNGPWLERFRLEASARGGGQVDSTPDARLMDLCYKVEAVNAGKKVVRRYEPICVPKFTEPQTQSFNLQRSPTFATIRPIQIRLGPFTFLPGLVKLPNNDAYLTPDSSLPTQITEAKPNVTVSNLNADLSGLTREMASALRGRMMKKPLNMLSIAPFRLMVCGRQSLEAPRTVLPMG